MLLMRATPGQILRLVRMCATEFDRRERELDAQIRTFEKLKTKAEARLAAAMALQGQGSKRKGTAKQGDGDGDAR